MSKMMIAESNPLISVIVPVYNVAKYVRRCIESVERQTYQSLEVILVDDGSTDGSGRICDELEGEFDNITVFHTANQGLSAARNFGMKHISGDYVVFVDSDDAIGMQHIAHLYETLNKYDTHIAVTGYTEVEESNISSRNDDLDSSFITSVMEVDEAINESVKLNGDFASHAWAKIYHKKMFPFLVFPEGVTFEDQYVAYKVFYNSGNVAYESANDYLYTVKRSSSISESDTTGRQNFFRALEEELEFTKEKVPSSFSCVYARYAMALMDAYIESVVSGQPNKKMWKLITDNRSNVVSRKIKSDFSNRYMLKYKLTFLGEYVFNIVIRKVNK